MPPIRNTPELKELTYAPLPWDTHPIDLVEQPQGWGPFNGPWTPWDFLDPAASISDGYDGDNEWQFAPPADILTVFGDRSLDLVGNTSYDVMAEQVQSQQEQSYTSTIANVVPNPNRGNFLKALRDALMGTGAANG